VKQGGEITNGVHYIAAPGHSPSHAAILFTSDKEQFMHMGDIAHNPVTSLQHPDWTDMSSDTARHISLGSCPVGLVASG
jgi:glyoxylase-like metal-dependent hydrolase (beta-lactamase superfamily II)